MAAELHNIEEPALIAWLQANCGKIDFIANELKYEPHKRTQELLNSIRTLDPAQHLFNQNSARVAALWRKLLGKAVVYLKSKDSREEYHDDEDYGVQKLNDFFEAFRHFEPLLYGAQDRYRDHLSHVLGVFLLGEYLIRETIGFDSVEVGDKDLEAGKITAEEKEAMWCVMALTHDLGIALEKIPLINDKVKGMLDKFDIVGAQGISYPFVPLPLDDFAIRFVSSDLCKTPPERDTRGFLTHVQSKYYLKFSEAYERRDHGIVSCLVLMKNLVFFLETDYTLDSRKPMQLEDARQFLIRRNILRAVAAHGNDNIYYLKLNEFPFLLRMCDELHERERPSFVEMVEGPKVDRKVKAWLDVNEASYQVAFVWRDRTGVTDQEKVKFHGDVGNYFDRKCEKIKRLLRSAVGGKDRHLTLTLEVLDELDPKPASYKIVHKTPEDIKITRP